MRHFTSAQNAKNVATLTALAQLEEGKRIELPCITYAFVTRWADNENLVLDRL